MSVTACDALPRDPEGTLDRVRNGTLRLGIVSHSPWAYLENDEPHGIEFDLAQQLASILNAELRWTSGGEADMLAALESFELDLVIGGFIEGKHAPSLVARTLSYYQENMLIATETSTTLPSLENEFIYIEFGSPYISWLNDHNANPQIVQRVTQSTLPAVMPEYQAQAWNLGMTDYVLTTHHHFMVTPPGENAWLHFVEEFLFELDEETITQNLIGEVQHD